jgi:hypothetical protein
MTEEKKPYSLKFEDGHLKIELDSNKDGEFVMKLDVDLSEVMDEAMNYFKKD